MKAGMVERSGVRPTESQTPDAPCVKSKEQWLENYTPLQHDHD